MERKLTAILAADVVGYSAMMERDGHWTVGVLANHVWTFETNDDPAGSLTFLQPFVSYALGHGANLTLNTESTCDWDAEQWTVPINLVFGQVIKLGKQPVQLQFGGRYYAEAQEGGPEWGLRAGVTFLFPKAK